MSETFPVSAIERNEPSWEAIGSAIENAYEIVAGKVGEDPAAMYHSRNCESVTAEIKRQLNDDEHVKSMFYVGWDITSHEFLAVTLEGKEWIVDATWQQFLKAPDPEKPKVLKALKEELEGKLRELGVPESSLHVWQKARSI